jgi:hypothetical protein
MKIFPKWLIAIFLLIPLNTIANIIACGSLASKSGFDYQPKPNIFAVKSELKSNEVSNVELLKQMGGWRIYQSDTDWFSKDECKIKNLRVERKTGKVGESTVINYQTYPVIWNQQQKKYAIFTGDLIIKSKQKLTEETQKKLNLTFKYPLATKELNVYKINTLQQSFDKVIEQLETAIQVETFFPVLEKKRYSTR